MAKALVRVKQDGKSASEVERVKLGVRVRDVAQGPDGKVYVLTDEDQGKILRLVPANGTRS